MNTKNRSRIYALIAAICFSVNVIYSLHFAWQAVENGSLPLTFAPPAFRAFAFFILAITLTFQRAKAVFAAILPCILYNIYWLVTDYYIGNLLWTAASIVFAAMVFSAITGKSDLKVIWFLPPLFVLIASILEVARMYFYLPLESLLNYTALFFAYFFSGLWLKTAVPQKAHLPSTRTHMQTDGTADQFKQYKQLLDSGAITEEEFQAKKKEKLDL